MRLSFLIRGCAVLAVIVSLSALAIPYVKDEGGIEWLRPEEDSTAAAMEGVWRSRGYGWVWAVQDGRVRAYDESLDLCLRSGRRSFDVDDFDESEIEISNDGKTIRVLMEDDQYRYVFDKIDALPVACRAKRRSDPRSVFDAVVKTLTAHYAFFDARGIDWERAVEVERAKVGPGTSEWELFKSITRLLSQFRDSHVSLEGSVGDDDLEYEPNREARARAVTAKETVAPPDSPVGYWNPEIVEELLGDTEQDAADGEITYGLIDGDIGYLSIGSMAGYSGADVDKAMKRANALFKDAKAVNVDVSLNDGGYDMIARRIASHFAAEQTVGYYKYPGDAEAIERQAIYLEPLGEAPFKGPVFLLTGDVTVSAAEIFVLAMRALPNVTQIGKPTDGSLSDILSKPLPNGWSITLSNEVYLNANGVGWEGHGIPPDIEAEVTYNSDGSERDVEAAQLFVDHVRALAADAEQVWRRNASRS